MSQALCMSVSEHEFLKHAYLLSPAPQKSFSTLMVSWKNANRNFPTERMHYEFRIVFRRKEFSFQWILKREEKKPVYYRNYVFFKSSNQNWLDRTYPNKCKLDVFAIFRQACTIFEKLKRLSILKQKIIQSTFT